ncbi:MAG: formin, partial [Polyangiaceae bacterium]|nr:formin [Polyangiaceae bacterium]
KIDLKARLGKKTVSAPVPGPGASIPPPAGIPKPSGIPAASGIPAPPFQSPATTSRAPAPVMDASNPYGAMQPSAAPVAAQAQTIRIELGDDVVRANRGGKSKIAMLAGVTALIGIGVGYIIGGAAERGASADSAVQGAKALVKDVETANTKISELADILKSAREKLGKSTFPEEEVTKLGALNIPFDGTNLSGKGIGRYKSEVVTMLISFASSAAEANDNKGDLQRVLSGQKKAVTDFLESQTKPKVRWSVIVGGSPAGPVGSMQLLPTPFVASEKWPDSFEVPGEKGKKITIKRYLKGDAASEDPTFIPVDPGTQGAVCPDAAVVRLRSRIGELEEVLRGNATPGEERTGLLEAGQTLVKKLKDIGKTAP